jgi:diguanylate cyclase (GGDEF)-like protein/putative nucleotidyltransferase with HDIG domain
LNNYNIKKITAIIISAAIITVIFFYLGVFSPLKKELENSLKENFINEVSINEISIENRFERYIEGGKSISSRTMIKNKLSDYNNQKISLVELRDYTQFKYVDGVKALDNILAAYRITDDKIVAQYGEFDLNKIESDFNKGTNNLEIILTNENQDFILKSPIFKTEGEKLGDDLLIFDISGFITAMNQNGIEYQIVQSRTELKQSLDQADQIIEQRRILNSDYWLKAVGSKNTLYNYLNSITTKIVTVFLILLISFLFFLYKTVSKSFNSIIMELKEKMGRLNEAKDLLENLTDQVPGALYQFQSTSGDNYFLPYASKGLELIFDIKPSEVEDANSLFAKIHKEDLPNFINSIEKSKENLTPWKNVFRVKNSEKELIWIEGNAQPEKLDTGEVLWHGYINNITERKKEKDELELQHQFQKSLAEVSSNLVNLSSDNIDYKINESLAVIGNFFDIDQIQILRLSDNRKKLERIHEWDDDLLFPKKDFRELSVAEVAWLIEEVQNKDFLRVCDIADLPKEAEKDRYFLSSQKIDSAVLLSINIDNQLFGFYIFGNTKEKGICDSKKIEYINIFTEVINRAIAKNLDEKKIEMLTYYDSLTGLYNRRFFEEEMKRLDTVRNLPFSILIADLNGLKIINDSYGHEKGDQILVQAAQILKESLREEDILARQGGDEFAVLLPNTKAKAAERIEKRIKEKCKKTNNNPLPVSIALGTATKEHAEQDIEEVLKKADDRMYKNKLSESRSSKSNIVQGLINILNSKSNETKEHSLRMTKIAFDFAQKLNLSNSDQNRLSVLATLHDIGKINIDEKILKKNGSLNEEEWAAVKKHSEYGYKIAKSSEEFAEVADEILAHHERWDGSGYPNRLQGEEIPYLARIITLVDAYDVMTNDRPYKKAVSEKEALQEIKACAGSQFDPNLVESFIEIIKD